MIRWKPKAKKQLIPLPRPLVERIVSAVENFYSTGVGEVKPLKGKYKGLYRLRVGNYRIIFQWLENGDMEIIEVLSREDAYR